MNYAAHIAPDPVAEEYSAADEMAPSLDSFVSESTIVQTASRATDYRHPLWEFPEEEIVGSSSSSTTPTVRGWRSAVAYASLALAIVMSAIAGFWWGKVSLSRSTATAVETAQPVANAPIIEDFRATPSVSLPQLVSSIQVQPSVWPPVATIVPGISLALPSLVTEQGRTADRETSMVPGADADQPVRSTMPANVTRLRAEPIPTGPSTVTNLPARSPAPVLEMPAAPTVPSAIAPPPPSTAPSGERPEPAALSSVVARTERSEIQRTLAQYRAAYDLLDAQAAQAVWPSVDVRALARAFDTLASQQLAFETCELQIAGESATAECRGSATYAPKIGNRGPRLEPRQWIFRLKKQGEEWKIQSAQTMR